MTEKNEAAQALGSLGGKARAARRTREELSAIGRKGAMTRWNPEIVKKDTKPNPVIENADTKSHIMEEQPDTKPHPMNGPAGKRIWFNS